MKMVNVAYCRALGHLQKRISATDGYRAGFTRWGRCFYQFDISPADGGLAVFRDESPGVVFRMVTDFVRINKILEGGDDD